MCFGILSVWTDASAAIGDCIGLSSAYDFTDAFFVSERLYRQNLSTYPIWGVSIDDVDYAVARGLGVWNDQSNVGSSTRLGNITTLTDLPYWDYQCAAAGIDYSLAVVQDKGLLGSMTKRVFSPTSHRPSPAIHGRLMGMIVWLHMCPPQTRQVKSKFVGFMDPQGPININ